MHRQRTVPRRIVPVLPLVSREGPTTDSTGLTLTALGLDHSSQVAGKPVTPVPEAHGGVGDHAVVSQPQHHLVSKQQSRIDTPRPKGVSR